MTGKIYFNLKINIANQQKVSTDVSAGDTQQNSAHGSPQHMVDFFASNGSGQVKRPNVMLFFVTW